MVPYPLAISSAFTSIIQCSTGRANSLFQFTSKKPKLNSHSNGVLNLKVSVKVKGKEEEEEEVKVVTAMRSSYNDIVIIDTPKSRLLLLDSTNNVHSILNKQGDKWTHSYWDEFATLPPILPKGPVAIFGLAGGTAAHLMLHLWPSLQLHGWEIDGILIDQAREHLGLSDLEKPTEAGGMLHVHIGDALSPSGYVSRKYAGIVVDLFSDGKVLAQLQQDATWSELNDRLLPNGRFMVNCGGINDNPTDGTWTQNYTINALGKAFPGKLSWKRKPKEQGENYLALTGPLPDLTLWSALVPSHLSEGVKQWKPCEP
ncbi:hypothetical protein CFOL_v3_23563 [Cephalotus follicularis]|uniref:Uncharacterized protein n=1 Tax=Cephalotus follicularis TaxID=3775 RepID=A0A1Q3CJ56_CEPFO|nr:hypothetical protein CFOL_v3_23563 [Cephalotus follicularis]